MFQELSGSSSGHESTPQDKKPEVRSKWLSKSWIRIATALLGVSLGGGAALGSLVYTTEADAHSAFAAALAAQDWRSVSKQLVETEAEILGNHDPMVDSVLMKLADDATETSDWGQRFNDGLSVWQIALAADQTQATTNVQEMFIERDRIKDVFTYINNNFRLPIPEPDSAFQPTLTDRSQLTLPITSDNAGCDDIASQAWCFSGEKDSRELEFGGRVNQLIAQITQEQHLTDPQTILDLKFIAFNWAEALYETAQAKGGTFQNFDEFLAANPDTDHEYRQYLRDLVTDRKVINSTASDPFDTFFLVARITHQDTAQARYALAIQLIRQAGAQNAWDIFSQLDSYYGNILYGTWINTVQQLDLPHLPMPEALALILAKPGDNLGLLDYLKYVNQQSQSQSLMDGVAGLSVGMNTFFPIDEINQTYDQGFNAQIVDQLHKESGLSLARAYIILGDLFSDPTDVSAQLSALDKGRVIIDSYQHRLNTFEKTMGVDSETAYQDYLQFLPNHTVTGEWLPLQNVETLGLQMSLLNPVQKYLLIESVNESALPPETTLNQLLAPFSPLQRTAIVSLGLFDATYASQKSPPLYIWRTAVDIFKQNFGKLTEDQLLPLVRSLQALNGDLLLNKRIFALAPIFSQSYSGNDDVVDPSTVLEAVSDYLTNQALQIQLSDYASQRNLSPNEVAVMHRIALEGEFSNFVTKNLAETFSGYYVALEGLSGYTAELDTSRAAFITSDAIASTPVNEKTGLDVSLNILFIDFDDETVIGGQSFNSELMTHLDEESSVVPTDTLMQVTPEDRANLFANRLMIILGNDGSIAVKPMTQIFANLAEGIQRVDQSQLAFSFVPLTETNLAGQEVPIKTDNAAYIQEGSALTTYVVINRDEQNQYHANLVSIAASFLPDYWSTLTTDFNAMGRKIVKVIATDTATKFYLRSDTSSGVKVISSVGTSNALQVNFPVTKK